MIVLLNHIGNCGKYLLLALLLCAGHARLAAQTAPTDVQVLSEKKDADGNIVRTIQYMQNGHRVVETRRILPPPHPNVPINPDTLNPDDLLVVINKSRYTLDVYYRRSRIRSYKAVFGPNPKENKKMKGDRCTPEGWYHIVEKHASARYNKFLALDYPNDSARVRFAKLKANGLVLPNAEIGGDVGIHGVWKGGDNMVEMGIGWTDGCIALRNEDIDELYRIVSRGVRVLIRKQ